MGMTLANGNRFSFSLTAYPAFPTMIIRSRSFSRSWAVRSVLGYPDFSIRRRVRAAGITGCRRRGTACGPGDLQHRAICVRPAPSAKSMTYLQQEPKRLVRIRGPATLIDMVYELVECGRSPLVGRLITNAQLSRSPVFFTIAIKRGSLRIGSKEGSVLR